MNGSAWDKATLALLWSLVAAFQFEAGHPVWGYGDCIFAILNFVYLLAIIGARLADRGAA